MEYDLYVDESGDLGWQFDRPYRKGGSSRFFTIAYLFLPTEKRKHIKRLIRRFHNERQGRYREYKGAEFNKSRSASMARTIISQSLSV